MSAISDIQQESHDRAKFYVKKFLKDINHVKKLRQEDRMEAIENLLIESLKEFGQKSCEIQIDLCVSNVKTSTDSSLTAIADHVKIRTDNIIWNELPF